jgi:hypothetical protein
VRRVRLYQSDQTAGRGARGRRRSLGEDDRARELEAQQPFGIEYYVRDVPLLEQVGTFNLVAAVYLFVYAATEEGLVAMCRAAHTDLVPDGRCLAAILNPELSEQHIAVSNQLGIALAVDSPIRDGATITITIPTPGGSIQINNYYWSKATYDRVLHSAGFRAIPWHPIGVALEGMQALGAQYWRDYLA